MDGFFIQLLVGTSLSHAESFQRTFGSKFSICLGEFFFCMGLVDFERNSTNILSSQDGQKREECWDGNKDTLENQNQSAEVNTVNNYYNYISTSIKTLSFKVQI